LLAVTLPAHAENWERVHKELFIDTQSMFTDSDGYTRFKTRELGASGTVMHQHKEAQHCALGKHHFRKMYSATAAVNNRNDSDVDADATWANWRQNPREVYNVERQAEIKNFVCTKVAAAKKSAAPVTPAASTQPKR
jgi:hypothetical protein